MLFPCPGAGAVAPRLPVRAGVGPDVALDRLEIHAQGSGDPAQGRPVRLHSADLLEPGQTSLPLRAANRLARVRDGATDHGHWFVACGLYAATAEQLPDRGRAPLEDPLGDLAGVLHQVPAVGDLHGVSCRLADRLGVGGGTVAGDDLDTRTGAEPRGDCRHLAVREQVDDPPALEVDEDGAVP